MTPLPPSFSEREALWLAPFAMRSADSRGRRYPQEEQPYRGPFQRDRDRILHCGAWRRLSGKMQVFTGDRGDYHRTRLTHTMEVASIARTIGRGLGLNEDLIEALALLHDLGHPPFGHAGEDALAECLERDGGFSHNRHAITIVEELERRYPDFPGLNLTAEVLSGQATRIDKTTPAAAPLLEVQVVETADSITYDAHDTDDAVKLGLVTLDELSQLELIRATVAEVRVRWGNIEPNMLRKATVHELIDRQVRDVLQTSAATIALAAPASAAAACRAGWLIHPSAELAARKAELEAFLYERVYRHADLVQVRRLAQRQMRELFDALAARPERLPPKYRDRIAQVGQRRAAAEFIAGMTDRYCVQQYDEIVGT